MPYPDFEWKTMSFHFWSQENTNVHAQTVHANQFCSLQKYKNKEFHKLRKKTDS